MGRYKTKIQSITEANQRILKEQTMPPPPTTEKDRFSKKYWEDLWGFLTNYNEEESKKRYYQHNLKPIIEEVLGRELTTQEDAKALKLALAYGGQSSELRQFFIELQDRRDASIGVMDRDGEGIVYRKRPPEPAYLKEGNQKILKEDRESIEVSIDDLYEKLENLEHDASMLESDIEYTGYDAMRILNDASGDLTDDESLGLEEVISYIDKAQDKADNAQDDLYWAKDKIETLADWEVDAYKPTDYEIRKKKGLDEQSINHIVKRVLNEQKLNNKDLYWKVVNLIKRDQEFNGYENVDNWVENNKDKDIIYMLIDNYKQRKDMTQNAEYYGRRLNEIIKTTENFIEYVEEKHSHDKRKVPSFFNKHDR